MTPCPCCDLAIGPGELTALRAERDELAAWKQHILDQNGRGKRPFSDRLAQAVIDSQVKEIDRLHAEIASLRKQPGAPLARVRHKKRGSTYRVIGEAEAQVSKGAVAAMGGPFPRRSLRDGCRLMVYQAEHDGTLWVRFTDEFRDGRFETIDDASSKEG